MFIWLFLLLLLLMLVELVVLLVIICCDCCGCRGDLYLREVISSSAARTLRLGVDM